MLPSHPGWPDLGWGGGPNSARGQGMTVATLVLGATHHDAWPVSLVRGNVVKFGGSLAPLHEPGLGVADCRWLAVCPLPRCDTVLKLSVPTRSAVMLTRRVLCMEYTLMLFLSISKDPGVALVN